MANFPCYDSWLEEPYNWSDVDCYEKPPTSEAVSASHGIFNWVEFALNNERRQVSESAWRTLINGPFPSPWLKVRFFLCYLRCLLGRLSGIETSSALAKGLTFVVSERSAHFADMEYYSASFEVEQVWEGRDCGRLVCVKEDDSDFSIKFYPIEEDLTDEQFN
jgi:hypothetical protein